MLPCSVKTIHYFLSLFLTAIPNANLLRCARNTAFVTENRAPIKGLYMPRLFVVIKVASLSNLKYLFRELSVFHLPCFDIKNGGTWALKAANAPPDLRL